jgi:hypothetical protein
VRARCNELDALAEPRRRSQKGQIQPTGALDRPGAASRVQSMGGGGGAGMTDEFETLVYQAIVD